MKKLLLFSIPALMLSTLSYAQSKKTNYYYVVKKDTVFCKSLSYGTTVQGYLKSINYEDLQGKKVTLSDKKDLPDVSTFYMNGSSLDKTPLKANKPNGYIRYTRRVVDGKIKVYLAKQGKITTTGFEHELATPANQMTAVSHPAPGIVTVSKTSTGAAGTYRFFVKLPNGTYYRINKKRDMKKFIKPFMLQCKEFAGKYKGDFSGHEADFIETAKLYNSLCK